jgi:hypothetical protein
MPSFSRVWIVTFFCLFATAPDLRIGISTLGYWLIFQILMLPWHRPEEAQDDWPADRGSL